MKPSKRNCVPSRSASVQHFIADCSGTSLVEYAMIVGLLVAGFVTAAWMLGGSQREVFNRLSTNFNNPSPESFAQLATARERAAEQDEQTKNAQLADGSRRTLFFAAGSVVLVGICLALTKLLKRGKASREDINTDLVEEQLSSNCPRFVEKRQKMLRVLSNHAKRLVNNQIQVGDLMSTNLTTVSPSAPVAEIRELMQREEIRHVLVCEGHKLVGVISDRDLRDVSGRTAKQIMTAHPITMPRASSILPAVTLMLERHISCLPVMDDDHVVGVFTTTDVAMALQCMSQILQQLAAKQVQDQTDSQVFELALQAAAH